MSNAGFSFNRRFKLWSYQPSHGQLLLRSAKSEDQPSRVDVLFKNVLSISLPTLFTDLHVELAGGDTEEEAGLNLGAWERTSEKVYLITGSGYRGRIVAGDVVYLEDTGEYDAPSALIQELTFPV